MMYRSRPMFSRRASSSALHPANARAAWAEGRASTDDHVNIVAIIRRSTDDHVNTVAIIRRARSRDTRTAPRGIMGHSCRRHGGDARAVGRASRGGSAHNGAGRAGGGRRADPAVHPAREDGARAARARAALLRVGGPRLDCLAEREAHPALQDALRLREACGGGSGSQSSEVRHTEGMRQSVDSMLRGSTH
jgi:hypothetical protein